MHWKWLLLLIVVNTAYLLIGGLIFSTLEQDNNEDVRRDTDLAYEGFLDNNSCVSEADLRRLAVVLISAYDAGLLTLPGENSTESEWSFNRAVFFCVTVVTTIGYGTISPSTPGGQLFLIFYAMFGIPLLLTFLAQVGVRIRKLNKYLADRIRFFENPRLDAFFDTLILFVLGYSVFVLAPAGIFTATEGWTYREATYYAVVTLSTVGFGDYVAGGITENDVIRRLYTFFLTVWMFLGLAWFAGVISTIQNKYETRVSTTPETPETKESTWGESRPVSREGSINKDPDVPKNQQESHNSDVSIVRF